MSSVKLKHSSGNGTVINGPAANPSADITLKVPSTTGSAGQVLKVASANHSSTNAELEWAADSGGLFTSYAIVCDQKSAGTGGGTSVANTWTARDLNTEIADPDSIVSIASNRFTLGAGDYLIKWSSPFFYTNRMITRLYDHTNTAVKQYGMSAYVPGSSGEQVPSLGWARISPTGSTAYEIQYYADNGDSDGLGHDSPDDVSTTIYTVVEIYKEV